LVVGFKNTFIAHDYTSQITVTHRLVFSVASSASVPKGCPRWLTAFSCSSRTEPSSQESKLCYDQLLVGQSAIISSPHLWSNTRVLLLSDICGFGRSFTIAAGPRWCSHSRVLVPQDSGPYFTVSDSYSPPQPGGYLYPPRDLMAHLYP
jgi:hypothetical protein